MPNPITSLITLRVGIYARYSSDNQRPESIEDQVAVCRKFATSQGYTVLDDHIYADEKVTGSRKDRASLELLRQAAENHCFDVLLVDDLSRLSRDNCHMLTFLAELEYYGVRVISVSDGLDSSNEESAIAIQVRGIINEVYLRDLKKKTLRGQEGQKRRGFFVGETTFGYESVAQGEVLLDKKGRPRPEGYKKAVKPLEAQVIMRVFREFAEGTSEIGIVKKLNQEKVPGYKKQSSQQWSVSTINRMLTNEKYIGKWVWNKNGTLRDRRTGRRRKIPKPQNEWIVTLDENLRIVPQDLWDKVQARRQEIQKVWPGGKGTRGFQNQNGSVSHLYPMHLLAGNLVCGECGNSVGQVGGKGGGYYGCFKAAKGGNCSNKLLVRRSLTERAILKGLQDQLSATEVIQYLLQQVEQEVKKMSGGLPEEVAAKEASLEEEKRKVQRFVHFIAEGKSSDAVANALIEAEKNTKLLKAEVDLLRQTKEQTFEAPPLIWVQERVAALRTVLARKERASALALRKVLGPIRLVPVKVEIGRPYYQAVSKFQTLSLLEGSVTGCAYEPKGSRSLGWWAV